VTQGARKPIDVTLERFPYEGAPSFKGSNKPISSPLSSLPPSLHPSTADAISQTMSEGDIWDRNIDKLLKKQRKKVMHFLLSQYNSI
jgi:hypothetical protein